MNSRYLYKKEKFKLMDFFNLQNLDVCSERLSGDECSNVKTGLACLAQIKVVYYKYSKCPKTGLVR